MSEEPTPQPRFLKSHHTQIARRRNIALIAVWIRDARKVHPTQDINLDAVVRKAQLIIGCSRGKAIEYVRVAAPELFEDE